MQTYKTVENKDTKILVLIDTRSNNTYYTDSEKAEAIASTFEEIHNKIYNTTSILDGHINSMAEDSVPENWKQIIISSQLIHNLIKKLPNDKTRLGQNNIWKS